MKSGEQIQPATVVEMQPFVLGAIRALPEETFAMLRESGAPRIMVVSTNTHTAILYPASVDGLKCIYGLDIHGSGSTLGLRRIIRAIALLCKTNNRAFAFRAAHKKWTRLFEKNGGAVVRQDEDYIVVFPPAHKGNGQ